LGYKIRLAATSLGSSGWTTAGEVKDTGREGEYSWDRMCCGQHLAVFSATIHFTNVMNATCNCKLLEEIV